MILKVERGVAVSATGIIRPIFSETVNGDRYVGQILASLFEIWMMWLMNAGSTSMAVPPLILPIIWCPSYVTFLGR
jgi:hypothetical protein